MNSDSTDSFVGVKSTGAEIEGKAVLSSLASLNYGAGYQALDWDDGIDDNNGLTARLGLDYQAPPDVMLNVFADHNVSENQYGIGARSNLGAGTLSSNYTRIDGNVGSISDDNRVSVTFAMPLRGATRGASGVTRSTSGAVAADTLTLLADVMRRPDYLPERVIVKASGAGGSVCDIDIDALTAATPLACEFGAVADQRNSTVLVSGNTVSWNDSQTVPLGDYAIYLITTDYDNTEVLSLGTSSIAGTSFSVSTAGQQFLNNYWDAERMTEVIFLQDDGNCGFEDQFSLSTNFDFIRPS